MFHVKPAMLKQLCLLSVELKQFTQSTR